MNTGLIFASSENQQKKNSCGSDTYKSDAWVIFGLSSSLSGVGYVVGAGVGVSVGKILMGVTTRYGAGVRVGTDRVSPSPAHPATAIEVTKKSKNN